MANRSVIHQKFMKSKAEDLPLAVAANLLANPQELDKMFKRWDERQELYSIQEQTTLAAIEELRKLEAEVETSQAELAVREDGLATREAAHDSSHENEMAILKRRATEIMNRENQADERDTGLDGRAKEIERLVIGRENEITEREEVTDIREEALDVREADISARGRQVDADRAKLITVSKMVKAAVAKL